MSARRTMNCNAHVFRSRVSTGCNEHPAQFNVAETGGVVTIQEPRQDLTATFRKALDEFRSSYVLRFSPTVTAPGFHTLEVSVPSRPKAALRARRGYWGS